ncbi:SDR family oxidoreductase [Chlorobaculum sp. 24CR]|uniref:SDR family NAD(P)-dependent oxidoreductase n=1 Tax=Chlorobaculum sp. 24CR TaxID=2508878 RepID=UPI00100C2363|nr:SDR family oxidoreductase [Chlorobaculum sp. 24CR]RXK88043.1 SDR family oxidoreductase [Chlorobaculum sp. 24CR]
MKVVVVTGATRGLGLAIARQCLADGYKVVAVGRTMTAQLDSLLEQYGERIAFERYDFSDCAGIHSFAVEIVKRHGRPWGLVNNAAIGTDGVLATLHEKDIARLIKINIEAPVFLTKYLLRGMLLNRCGRIINISSIVASTGFNGLSVYGATKAAVAGFTKSLAREVGKANITVNTLAPGFMETDMTSKLQDEKLESIRRRSPSGQLTSVEDAAHAVSYLLSDNAEHVTGTTITVDYGATA